MNPDEQGSSGLAQADEGLAAQSGGLDSGLSPKINRDPPPRGPLIPKRKLRLLMLEDQSSDADLILRELQRAGFDLDSHRVETEPDFVARLDPSLDLILADFRLPGGFNGMQALRLVQQRGLDIPFIVISATVRDELGVE